MIVKLFAAGKSFKGVVRYLTHDPEKAKTSERVDWTRTLNLANDHLPSAVDEMLWTYRAADLLKQQAGLAAGGRRLKHAAKHFSLNWHPSEQPTREHMIETVRDFLRHMGWHEQQAILVGHKDKHPHVHVLINAVHPETGRALDTSFEKRRAQEWALGYERAHDLIFCEERLKPKEERTPSPTRATWETLRQAEHQHDKVEAERVTRTTDYFERHDATVSNAKEWEALKSHQRDQRDAFFAGGKQAYREVRNAVFREVRTEFRDQWKVFFQMRREGADFDLLKAIKDGILKRQNDELAKRRDPACAELRAERDETYKQLLQDQKVERAWLTTRQKEGLRSPDLLDLIYGEEGAHRHEKSQSTEQRQQGFRGAGQEVCAEREPAADFERHIEPEPFEHDGKERHRVRDPANAIGDLGMGAVGALATIGERLFESLLGGGTGSRPQAPAPTVSNKPDRSDNVARSAEKHMRTSEAEANEAEQLQRFWADRKRRRGRDRD